MRGTRAAGRAGKGEGDRGLEGRGEEEGWDGLWPRASTALLLGSMWLHGAEQNRNASLGFTREKRRNTEASQGAALPPPLPSWLLAGQAAHASFP